MNDTDRRLAEIGERWGRTTPGEWKADDSLTRTAINTDSEHIALANLGLGLSQCNYNAEFIAHAHQDVPFLLSEIAALRKRLREIGDYIEEYSETALTPEEIVDWVRQSVEDISRSHSPEEGSQ